MKNKIVNVFFKAGFIVLLLGFGFLFASCLFDFGDKKVIALFFTMFGIIFWAFVSLLDKATKE